jgi:hypothetical protein
VAYSVMVWMVAPGRQAHEEEELARSADRVQNPGAASGVNEPPAFTRLVYGVYESRQEAEGALETISGNLQRNEALRFDMHGDRTFLVPASRVHYVVCDEVDRPKDHEREVS